MGWTALEDKNENEIGYTGDEVWDAIGDFTARIMAAYLAAWGRPPNKAEIDYIADDIASKLTTNDEQED